MLTKSSSKKMGPISYRVSRNVVLQYLEPVFTTTTPRTPTCWDESTVKILKFGTPQTIAIIVLKVEKFDVTLH